MAGPRAAALEKKRHHDQQEFEQRRNQIVADHARQNAIGSKFANAQATSLEDQSFQDATVGLVTAEQFRELQQLQKDGPAKNEANAQQQQQESEVGRVAREKTEKRARKRRIKAEKQRMATLSFAGDDDDDGDNEQQSSMLSRAGGAKKDPTIDTSFLPDKARDAAVEAERQRLMQEWKIQQEQVKQEKLEIVYSYWDGSGHRRTVTVRQGDTIEQFLEQVRKDLIGEFRELANTSSDALVYVKEDLMLPHDLTFYDLIACKARGKSGPLFHFDVHDDVRVGAIDVRVEKDESHPGKIVQRHWYERNKHIFPASRWEVYDPTKEYGSYTIGGKEVN